MAISNGQTARRVLLLSTSYLPQIGGSELAIKHITDRMPEWEFDLVTAHAIPSTPAQERIGNVTVFRVGNALARISLGVPKLFLPLAIAARAWRLLRHQRYDIIHAYQASQAAGAGWLLSWLYPSIPFVVTLQEGKDLIHQNYLIKLFRWLILRRADACTAISTYLHLFIIRYHPNLPVHIIPNGVDSLFFQKPETYELERLRASLGIPADHRIIISVSRLVEKNGIADLIAAMPLVRHDHPVTLVLVGGGQDEAALRQAAAKQNVPVVFVGSVTPELSYCYLYLGDVFVRPSRSEGLGNAFLEAMAAGVPVVGTGVGGIPDFLLHEETGLMCRVGDPHDIALQISRLLNDAALADRVRGKAQQLVRDHYQWPVIAERMRTLYTSLV